MHVHKEDSSYSEKRRSLLLGILLNGLFTIVELVAGIFTNSLALLSDALHDFTDTGALLLSYMALVQSKRSPTAQKTFGFQRATIIGAFINGSVLLILSFVLMYKAYGRLRSPEPVISFWLVIVALVGLVVNGLVALRLHRHTHDLNMRSVWWHMVEDVLSWAGVLVAGIIMHLTHWYIIDPIVSIIISIVVLIGGYRILSDTVHVLLEGVPKGVSLQQVEKSIRKERFVNDVHDLHVWSLGSEEILLSCHIVTDAKTLKESLRMVERLKKRLHEEYGIHHATIECESKDCGKGC